MGAITDRVDISLETVKAYLFIDNNHEDTVLEILRQSAITEAETYCNNDFVDVPIPYPIKTWVLRRIARMYEQRAEGKKSEQISGLTSTTWGDNELNELHPYRINPGL